MDDPLDDIRDLSADPPGADPPDRSRRVALVAGAIVAAVVVIAAGVVLFGGDDDDGATSAANDGPPEAVPIPPPRERDFEAAVKAAGCTFTEHRSEGAEHRSEPYRGYKTNPPTSGPHSPMPAPDGVYEPGNSPDPNNWVHTLEHGRVIIQYAPGTPKKTIDQLATLTGEDVKGSPGYHMLLMENTTDMPYEVAAVTWTRTLGCKRWNDRGFDAIRVFRDRFVDTAPELVP